MKYLLHRVGLATIGACVFCAVASVAALFIFGGKCNEKIVAAILALAMLLVFTACESSSQSKSPSSSLPSSDSVEIGEE